MNLRKIKAIEKENEKKLLEAFPNLENKSGIYILTRQENGFKYAYIGQSNNMLARMINHMRGYNQHIDLSLKKHGLYSSTNPEGWHVSCFVYFEGDLNEWEQFWIKKYAQFGYQLLNKTTGSQGSEKRHLGEAKERKGYRQGVFYGYNKAKKEIALWFEKYLDYSIKQPTNKNKEKAFNKFTDFLREANGNNQR